MTWSPIRPLAARAGRPRPLSLYLCSGVLALLASAGCSSEEEPPGPGSGGSAAGGASGSGAAAPSSGGSAGAPSSSGGSAGGGATGGSSGAPSSGGSGGSGGSAGGGQAGAGFTEVGVCGQRGRSMVGPTSFDGFEEFYIIGEEGLGDDICVVRFDVERTGDGQAGCTDLDGYPCAWTHEVTISNPSVEVDTDGVCAKSELGLDAARLAELDGSVASYGFVSEYAGHNSVLLRWDAASDSWIPFGNATWDEETGAFRFDNRMGTCRY